MIWNGSTAALIKSSKEFVLTGKTGVVVSLFFSGDGSSANWVQNVPANRVPRRAALKEWFRWCCGFGAFSISVTCKHFVLARKAAVLVVDQSPSDCLSADWIKEEGAVRLA